MSESRAPLTGTRIRDKRLDRGIRQADLAHKVDISPSYLNLIEHNKRRIAGRLLADIARALAVEPAQLTDGAERGLLDQMLTAAAGIETAVETDKIDEMASRYPGWAQAVATLAQERDGLLVRVQELSDRMTHDPALSASLHSVISAVTSIRSTASILTSGESLDADWLRRFHTNIHNEARRLAESSESLVRFLDAPDQNQNTALNPFVEFEAALSASDTTPAELAKTKTHEDLSTPARDLMEKHIQRARALMRAMPDPEFGQAAREAQYDPGDLAVAFGQPLSDVMFRLALLREEDGHPPIGIATCDAAGAVTYLKPAGEFSLSRGGQDCPLWPIFTALGQPGRPVRADVILPDSAARPLRCFAVAEQTSYGGFDLPPIMQSTMLVLTEPDQAAPNPLPLGPSCRICMRSKCPARREPSVIARDLL